MPTLLLYFTFFIYYLDTEWFYNVQAILSCNSIIEFEKITYLYLLLKPETTKMDGVQLNLHPEDHLVHPVCPQSFPELNQIGFIAQSTISLDLDKMQSLIEMLKGRLSVWIRCEGRMSVCHCVRIRMYRGFHNSKISYYTLESIPANIGQEAGYILGFLIGLTFREKQSHLCNLKSQIKISYMSLNYQGKPDRWERWENMNTPHMDTLWTEPWNLVATHWTTVLPFSTKRRKLFLTCTFNASPKISIPVWCISEALNCYLKKSNQIPTDFFFSFFFFLRTFGNIFPNTLQLSLVLQMNNTFPVESKMLVATSQHHTHSCLD